MTKLIDEAVERFRKELAPTTMVVDGKGGWMVSSLFSDIFENFLKSELEAVGQAVREEEQQKLFSFADQVKGYVVGIQMSEKE